MRAHKIKNGVGIWAGGQPNQKHNTPYKACEDSSIFAQQTQLVNLQSHIFRGQGVQHVS